MKFLCIFTLSTLGCLSTADIIDVNSHKFNLTDIRSGLTLRTDRYTNTGNEPDFSKLGVIFPKSYSTGTCHNAIMSNVRKVQCDIPESGECTHRRDLTKIISHVLLKTNNVDIIYRSPIKAY